MWLPVVDCLETSVCTKWCNQDADRSELLDHNAPVMCQLRLPASRPSSSYQSLCPIQLGTAKLKNRLLSYESTHLLRSSLVVLLWVHLRIEGDNLSQVLLDCGDTTLELPPYWDLSLSLYHGLPPVDEDFLCMFGISSVLFPSCVVFVHLCFYWFAQIFVCVYTHTYISVNLQKFCVMCSALF